MKDNIYQIPEAGVRSFWANPENPDGEIGGGAKALNGRKGEPYLPNFKPGETRVLAHAEGPGVIRHIWITTEQDKDPRALKGFRLDCFWDGEQKPAVSVPLGDFFCFNTACPSPMENELFSNPEGRSFNCYVPMPFRLGMKITITNETKDLEDGKFFYQIDYTLGDNVKNALYFHAYYNRERDTRAKQDYVILPKIDGTGRYLGASFGVTANPLMGKSWWGEGEVKCYIDGDYKYPTLAGTGTEDYIGTGWGQGRYINRYQGCPHADEEAMRYAFYRFHVPDPVYFTRDIRITIQQIGCAENKDVRTILDNGIGILKTDGTNVVRGDDLVIFERFDDDWCSVAYFYLDKPTTRLPQLPSFEERSVGYYCKSKE